MLPTKSNLPEPPRKPREARWPEDARRVKNLEVGDVLVVDGKRYGVRKGSLTIACWACALNVANVKGRERCVALSKMVCKVLPCEMCNCGALVDNDYYFESL